MTCSCCGGEKVVVLAPSSVTMSRRFRPAPSKMGPLVLICRSCDRVHLWPTAYRFKRAWR